MKNVVTPVNHPVSVLLQFQSAPGDLWNYFWGSSFKKCFKYRLWLNITSAFTFYCNAFKVALPVFESRRKMN